MQTDTRKKIILGGGISGLLYAFYNPDCLLISDKIGGQSSSRFQLGPRILHADENTTRLLEDLNRYIGIKKIKVGYFYNDKINDENTEENKKAYFEKTRGESSQPYSSVMSSNKNEYDSYDIELSEIIENLERKIHNEIILGKVTKIDLENNKLIIDEKEIEYSKLISTIPINVFLFLAGKTDEAKQYVSYPTTFILSDNLDNAPFKDFGEYDYVYISDEKYPFHRITKTKDGFVYEYKGDMSSTSLGQKDREVLKVGQLVENDKKVEFDNVNFLGRYATWKHNILINDLLKEIYTKK